MQTSGQAAPSVQQPQAAAAKPAPPPKPVPPPEFQSAKIDGLEPAALVDLLKDPASTTFQKAKACQRLASVGTKDAVPVLAALLANPQLSHYARYGLEPISDPSADDALRAALPKVKGMLLVGVINSIGYRRDAKAVPALTKLMYTPGPEVAKAAAAALGRIGNLSSSNALQQGLVSSKGPVRDAIAAAGIVCAEGLLGGSRAEALALYARLSRPDIPKPVRLAAMHGVIAAETSLSRPR